MRTIRRFMRTVRTLIELSACLDVVDTEGGRAIVPIGNVDFGDKDRPFAEVSVDKNTFYVWGAKGANWEAMLFSFNAADNLFEIRTDAAGTGTRRAIRFTANSGTDQLIIDTDGTADVPPAGALRYDTAQNLTTAQRERFKENLGI